MNRLRTYAWSYFSYHADQRLKAFNFYLLVVLGITAAVVTVLGRSGPQQQRYASVLCYAIAFASAAFALLDRRNAQLVKNGEAALEYLDRLEGHVREGDVPHTMEIIALDHQRSESKKSVFPLYLSYSDIFSLVFAIFGAVGLIFGFLLF